MPLTADQIKQADPKPREYPLFDSDGLVLRVPRRDARADDGGQCPANATAEPCNRGGRRLSWENRIVETGDEAPDNLMAHPQNWRIHPQFQQDAVREVIEQVGWVQPVIVNRATGNLVDGHLRVTIAMRNEEPTVPVQYVELSEEEERLILTTLDPLAGLAGQDSDKLEELSRSVQTEGESLQELLDQLQLDAMGAADAGKSGSGKDDEPGDGAGSGSEEYAAIEFVVQQGSKEFIYRVLRDIKSAHGLETMGEALQVVCEKHDGQ